MSGRVLSVMAWDEAELRLGICEDMADVQQNTDEAVFEYLQYLHVGRVEYQDATRGVRNARQRSRGCREWHNEYRKQRRASDPEYAERSRVKSRSWANRPDTLFPDREVYKRKWNLVLLPSDNRRKT